MTDRIQRMHLANGVYEFQTFRDDDSLDQLIQRVRREPAYQEWRTETIKAVSLTNPTDDEECAERFVTILEAYARRYQHLFDPDEEDAFEEFHSTLVERERETYLEFHSNLSEVANREAELSDAFGL